MDIGCILTMGGTHSWLVRSLGIIAMHERRRALSAGVLASVV